MHEQVMDRIRKVLVEVLRVKEESVTLESRYKEDLGADSLDTVTLLMALEEEFKEPISDKEAEGLTTVKATVEFIEARLAAAGAIGQ